MNIFVTDSALEWFRRELGLKSGSHVRLFAKYGGTSPFHPGFSIGIHSEAARDVAVQCERDGILFYIREGDVWLFENHDLAIRYDAATDDIVYDMVSPRE